MNSGRFGATSTDLFLVLILAAVFLGGPGQPYGAMLGALVIGLATEMSAASSTPTTRTSSRRHPAAHAGDAADRFARRDGRGRKDLTVVYYMTNILVYTGVDAIAASASVTSSASAGSPTSASSSSRRPAPTPPACCPCQLQRQRRLSALRRGWNCPSPCPDRRHRRRRLLAIPFAASWGGASAVTSPPSACSSPPSCSICWSTTTCRCSTAPPGCSLSPRRCRATSTRTAPFQWGYGIVALLLAFGTYLFVPA